MISMSKRENKENKNQINERSGSSDSSGLNIHYSETSSDNDIDINLYH
jgi:hypothetical protein